MTQPSEALRSMLEHLVRELVDQPERVEVAATASDGGNTIVLTVRTASGEVGKVIGKRGKNAQAIRTLMEAVAAKYKQRVVLEIADDARRAVRNERP